MWPEVMVNFGSQINSMLKKELLTENISTTGLGSKSNKDKSATNDNEEQLQNQLIINGFQEMQQPCQPIDMHYNSSNLIRGIQDQTGKNSGTLTNMMSSSSKIKLFDHQNES